MPVRRAQTLRARPGHGELKPGAIEACVTPLGEALPVRGAMDVQGSSLAAHGGGPRLHERTTDVVSGDHRCKQRMAWPARDGPSVGAVGQASLRTSTLPIE